MQYNGRIDGPIPLVKRQRALCADYESQIGGAITPATRSLIARAVSIEMSLELIEAEQVTGKPINAEMHARLAGVLARLLDRLGLTARSGAAAALPPFDLIKMIRGQADDVAQTIARENGWSDAVRDRFAEKEFQRLQAEMFCVL
jgi:hypothetical protein